MSGTFWMAVLLYVVLSGLWFWVVDAVVVGVGAVVDTVVVVVVVVVVGVSVVDAVGDADRSEALAVSGLLCLLSDTSCVLSKFAVEYRLFLISLASSLIPS